MLPIFCFGSLARFTCLFEANAYIMAPHQVHILTVWMCVFVAVFAVQAEKKRISEQMMEDLILKKRQLDSKCKCEQAVREKDLF